LLVDQLFWRSLRGPTKYDIMNYPRWTSRDVLHARCFLSADSDRCWYCALVQSLRSSWSRRTWGVSHGSVYI
jgi:hypothetical protein